MKRTLTTLVIAFFAVSFLTAQKPLTAADSSKYAIYWWHSKDMYDHLPDTKGEIIFLGNSITDCAEWFELLDNSKCHNRGISGDVTDGILLRLDAITRLKPAKIFLMIGINDLSKGKTVEEITANYRKILDQIKTETPKTKLFVESVLPVNPKTNPNIPHTGKTKEVMELNKNLKSLADEYGHQYVDLFSLMADSNNYLPKKYSLDGLHLTYAGYKVWVDAIKSYIN